MTGMALEIPAIPLESILPLTSAHLSRGSGTGPKMGVQAGHGPLPRTHRHTLDPEFSNLEQLCASYILNFYLKKKCNHGWKSCRVCSFQDVTTKRKLWPYPNQFPKQESVSSRHSDQTASQSRMCIIKVALTHGVLQNFPAALVPRATPTLRTAHVSRHARPAKAA